MVDQWQHNPPLMVAQVQTNNSETVSFIYFQIDLQKIGFFKHFFLGFSWFTLFLSNESFCPRGIPDMCQLHQHVPVPFHVSRHCQERGHLVLRNPGIFIGPFFCFIMCLPNLSSDKKENISTQLIEKHRPQFLSCQNCQCQWFSDQHMDKAKKKLLFFLTC